jgi:ribokinase
MRMAVVGHVEWIEFLRVEAVPRPGEIVGVTEWWGEPAGGGGVAAVELARLAGESSLFCRLGGDEAGRDAKTRLEAAGVRVHTPESDDLQRRGFVYLDEGGERTITILGEKPRPAGGDGALPWEELAESDGVYFTAGDPEAVRQARRARVLVATARELHTLQTAAVELDALVASGEDDAERYQAGDLDPPPKLVVSTAGALGGWAQPGGPYKAAPRTDEFEDAYGAGDCFAAGLTFALAQGLETADALAFAAERGALALSRRGAGLSSA